MRQPSVVTLSCVPAQGAAALLTQAERDLAHSARFDESLQPLHDTIADLMYQAQDAAEQLRDRLYRLSYSADELEQLEERLDLLHRLRRKYGADCAAILDYLARAKAELEEMELRSSLAESAEDVMSDSNVYNILLIGADGRTEELERSDAMILLSINKTTKTMWLTSLMRDTQVEIADWGIGHLNWATRFGGVDMLINTIESTRNFAVNVDNWAMVDFLDFAKIASMVGPITVTVTKEEAADINLLIREACQLNDTYYGTDVPRCYFPTDQDGTYTISDGFQILGYCRERHVGGDTGRSQKQRDALMQMWGNVKKMSLAEQYALAKDIMSIISTDLTMGQCASLLLQAPDFLTYDIQMQQCPTPGSFWRGLDANGLSIYNADFVINRNFLRATIYGEPMSAADLTSYWSGNAVQVYYPPESDTGDENG